MGTSLVAADPAAVDEEPEKPLSKRQVDELARKEARRADEAARDAARVADEKARHEAREADKERRKEERAAKERRRAKEEEKRRRDARLAHRTARKAGSQEKEDNATTGSAEAVAQLPFAALLDSTLAGMDKDKDGDKDETLLAAPKKCKKCDGGKCDQSGCHMPICDD